MLPSVRMTRRLLWYGTGLFVSAAAGTLWSARTHASNRYHHLPAARIEEARSADRGTRGIVTTPPFGAFASLWCLSIGERPPERGPVPPSPGPREICDCLAVTMICRTPSGWLAAVRYLDGPSRERTVAQANVHAAPRVIENLVAPGDRLRAPFDAPPYAGCVADISASGVLLEWAGRRFCLRPRTITRADG